MLEVTETDFVQTSPRTWIFGSRHLVGPRKVRRDKKYEWFVIFGRCENQELMSRSIDMQFRPAYAQDQLALKADDVSSATVASWCDALHIWSYS